MISGMDVPNDRLLSFGVQACLPWCLVRRWFIQPLVLSPIGAKWQGRFLEPLSTGTGKGGWRDPALTGCSFSTLSYPAFEKPQR
jgi:hypothetical protein